MSHAKPAFTDPAYWENWLPTNDNINALPEPLRKYIHAIHTLSDPNYIVTENVLMRDIVRSLENKIAELEERLGEHDFTAADDEQESAP